MTKSRQWKVQPKMRKGFKKVLLNVSMCIYLTQFRTLGKCHGIPHMYIIPILC